MSHIHRLRHILLPPFVPLALAALTLLAGCSSSGSSGQPGGAPVASLSGHGHATATASQLSTAQSDRDEISFTRCMRAHGVQMTDPAEVPGHVGLSLNLPTRDSATASAYQACLHFMPWIASKTKPGTPAPDLPALTAYARCMRAHDISMPDPDPQGELNLGPVPGVSNDFGRYSPQFRAADTACRHLLPPGVHDDGTGP
jgi:hypothetical protein